MPRRASIFCSAGEAGVWVGLGSLIGHLDQANGKRRALAGANQGVGPPGRALPVAIAAPAALSEGGSAVDAVLQGLHPRVKADVQMGLATTGGLASSTDLGATIAMRMVPIFERLTVREVQLGDTGSIDISSVGAVFAGVLNRYAGTVTAAIGKLEIGRISVPAAPFAHKDLSQSIRIRKDDGSSVDADIKALPISSPVRISSIVPLIDADQITVLAQLTAPDVSPSAPGSTGPAQSFGQLRTGVDDRVHALIGAGDWRATEWVAIGKPLVATLPMP